MRLILATADATGVRQAMEVLLPAGHRVVAIAPDMESLPPSVARETPEAIVVLGDLGDPARLAITLRTLGTPAVVVVSSEVDATLFSGIATIVLPDAPLLPALQQLATAPPSSGLPVSNAAPDSPLPLTMATPNIEAAGENAPGVSHRVILGVTGGVGASTLTLTLAAAGAEAGLASVACIDDPYVAEARLGLTAPGAARHSLPHLQMVYASDATVALPRNCASWLMKIIRRRR